MRFDIMTIFPDMVDRILGESVIGRARKSGHITVACHNIRDFSENKHRKTDDTPYGGGFGMVMTAQPIYDCYRSIVEATPEITDRRVIYMSPKGRLFDQSMANELAKCGQPVILCGHYEGVDERIIEEIVTDEISIGDYVLTGGELPACVVTDAVARLIPGVLRAPECHEEESIASGLLEYPQYTKPPVFMGREVPPILLSGDHGKIAEWRRERSLEITRERRPDLIRALEEKES